MTMEHGRLIELLYGSMEGDASLQIFMHALATAFRSELVATQIDSTHHMHRPLTHYDGQGRRCLDLDNRYISSEIENPWFAAQAAARLRAVGTASDNGIISAKELRRTDFYQYVLKPLNVFHSIGFLLEQTEDGVSFLSLSRSARIGPYSGSEERLARQLLPHFRNLMTIQAALSAQRRTTPGNHALAAILDNEGRLVQIIGEGEQSLGALFIGRRQQLWPAQPLDRSIWQEELSAIQRGDRLTGAVPLHDARGTYVATASLHRIPDAHHLSWLLRELPAVLLTVGCPQRSRLRIEQQLTDVFKLTAAETRTALELYAVERIASVSERLGRSEETVRSQLKSIFGKTGVNSQLQLLRLLDRLADHGHP